MRKIGLALFSVFLCICFAGCHADIADVPPLQLLGEGAPVYTVVRSDTANEKELAAVSLLRKYMEKCGVRTGIQTDWEKNPVSEYEIVIGDTLRGASDPAMTLSVHDVGKEGFFVKVVGSRIYIAGGSPAAAERAAEHFLTQFFGYTGDPETFQQYTSLEIPGDYEYIERQKYDIASITVDGSDLRNFRITWDKAADAKTMETYAAFLQEYFYSKAGIWIEIDRENKESGPALILSGGYEQKSGTISVRTENGNLVMQAEPLNAFRRGLRRFTAEYFEHAQGDVVLDKTFSFEADLTNEVTYLEFGAVGDGVADDFPAIIAAHEFANQHNLPVKADAGKVFRIGASSQSAVIKTDTDFSGAEFIIDDRSVPLGQRRIPVFSVPSTTTSYNLNTLKSVKKGQTNLGITLPADSILILNDDTVRRYARRGMVSGGYTTDANDGSGQTELIVVDKNGNVDPNAPIIWDYDKFTLVSVIPLEEKTLTIRGGKFTTVTQQKIPESEYFSRGFTITRSNVILDGVEHYVKGEGIDGAPYYSFLHISNCANITVQNCVFTPHRTFFYTSASGGRKSMGTYDITPMRVANLTFRNCSQSIDITDNRFWSIMGTNFCKNFTLDNCSFSCFDAHQGVVNAVIRNSELGYHAIGVVGFGTLLAENTTFRSESIIRFKTDYGAFWEGDVILRNCIWEPGATTSGYLTKKTYTVFVGNNHQDYDFKQTCSMPSNIIIENLRVKDSRFFTEYNGIEIFDDFNPSRTNENYEKTAQYAYAVPETLQISGFVSEAGRPWKISKNSFMFREVKILE